jgi:hypothetical protein
VESREDAFRIARRRVGTGVTHENAAAPESEDRGEGQADVARASSHAEIGSCAHRLILAPRSTHIPVARGTLE